MDPTAANEEDPGPLEGWTKAALAWFLGIGIGVIVLVALGAAYQIGFNRGKDEAPQRVEAPPAAKAPAPPQPAGPGRELFVANCGSCHTLSAADTSGTVGPNLDDLQPDDAQVKSAIEIGGTGSGAMPAGLLAGKQAEEVAAYVAASAGG